MKKPVRSARIFAAERCAGMTPLLPGEQRRRKRLPLGRGDLINAPADCRPPNGDMSATLELARALMPRRSVTPADEGCQEVMMRRLQALGFEIEPLRFGGVENFWARHGR